MSLIWSKLQIEKVDQRSRHFATNVVPDIWLSTRLQTPIDDALPNPTNCTPFELVEYLVFSMQPVFTPKWTCHHLTEF